MLRTFIVAVFVLVWASPAFADAIDGDWCGDKGLHLTIKEPDITKPYGVTLKGNYHQHEFAYIATAGYAYAGQLIYPEPLCDGQLTFYRIKDWAFGKR